MSIDVIGMIDGAWHVIATAPVAGCLEWISDDAPPRVFAGAETVHYKFESEDQAREALGWDGEQFNPQFEQCAWVPASITNRQAKLVLLQAGMLDAFENTIAAILDDTERRHVQVEWEYAIEFYRSWPTLLKMQHVMGLSDEQIDMLFVKAATL